MHFNNDNEMNSSAIHITSSANNKISTPTPIPTPTPSPTTTASSCTSSTDSGVIIIDNERTFSNSLNNANNKSNSNNNNNNSNDNNHNSSHTCNGTSETAPDNANINGDNREMRSDEKLHFCKNIDINHKSDTNKNINIANIININQGTSAQNHNVEINIEDNGRRPYSRSVSKPSSKAGSPTVSIRSTTISIVSIDENAIDSSIVDSDSDFETDAEGVHSNYTVKKLGQQTTYAPDNPDLPHINKGLTVISQSISPGLVPPTAGPLSENILNGGALGAPVFTGAALAPTTPQIGSIALSNSTDVTFGDKHFYEGPVTIQQFLIDNREKWKANEQDGQDNPTFACDGKPTDRDDLPKGQYSTTERLQPFKFIFNRKAAIITSTIIVLIILIGIIIVTSNALRKPATTKSKLLGDGDDSRKHIPINSTIVVDHNKYVFNGSLLIIDKNAWQAAPEEDGIDKLDLPVHRVIISHTATSICDDKADCDARVRSVQDFHMLSNGWSDIGYNFLVGGDGLVYEGRGWENLGAHTKGYNRDSLGISFIGTFIDILPTKNDLIAAQLLIEEGVRRKALVPDYRLYGARQLSGTESPGKALYNVITQWPHWTRQI